MTEDTIVAVLGVLGTLGAAALVWLTAAQTRAAGRTRALEHDIAVIARENRALWYYTRHLIDWGYRPHGPGDRPPEPPQSIRHLYEFGDSP